MRIVQLKSSYNSLINAPRGLGCQTQLVLFQMSAAVLNFGANGKCYLSGNQLELQRFQANFGANGKCHLSGNQLKLE